MVLTPLNEVKKIRCDLHGFRLFEAIEEIIDVIEYCVSSGDSIIFIIHGYRHGQVLKNYFRSKNFIVEMMVLGYHLKVLNHPNRGVTTFELI